METRTFRGTRLLFGLALLAPMATTCLLAKLVPALLTAFRSLQNATIVQPARYVGLSNYAQLLDDPRFLPSVGHTFSFLAIRLLVSSVLPVGIAFVLNKLARPGRTLYRLWFTLILLLCVPISLIYGWQILTHPLSGPLRSSRLLANPDTALLALLSIDGLTAFAIACTGGTMLYMMVFRGANGSRGRASRPLLATWLIVNLVVAFGSVLVFDLPSVLTAGGPMNSTMTWTLYAHTVLFRFFQMGYAAAMYVPLTLILFLLIFLVWGITEWGGLRLVILPASGKASSRGWLIGLIMVPIVLLAALPVLLPHFYSLASVISPPQSAARYPGMPAQLSVRVLVNSLIPVVPLLFLALPCAYLAALSISLIRPFGRVGSSVLFLLLLLGSAIPLPLLLGPTFEGVRWLGTVNTVTGLALPYLVSGAAFYIFKLHFDGRAQEWDRAVHAGSPALSTLLDQAVVPSLPIVLLVIEVITFATVATGSMEWMIAVSSKLDQMPWPVLIASMSATMQNVPGALALRAIQWTTMVLLLWGIPAIPLQIRLLDRLALVGRLTDK